MNMRRERGITLMMVLIMLVIITLFAVSMVRLSTTNLKVVSGMQSQRALLNSAQQAIEERLNSSTYFTDAAASTGTWPSGTTSVSAAVNGYSVTLSKPECLYSEPAEGYSATAAISPEDTYWEATASATDSITGATATVAQGIKMRLTAGNCS